MKRARHSPSLGFLVGRSLPSLAAATLLLSTPGTATAVEAVWTAATDVPITASSYSATGASLNLTLNFAPSPGDRLTVINNTGLAFINGTFSNLAHGQVINLGFGGESYSFVANYYGGSGNDLVLQWARTRFLAWGDNGNSQLGNNSDVDSHLPTPVDRSGVLAGKIIMAVSTGWDKSVALCSDGTVAMWGDDTVAVKTDTGVIYPVPVAVNQKGVLAGRRVIAVSAGYRHILALCSDGVVAAWGHNTFGQLGDDFTATYYSHVPVLVKRTGVLAGKTVVAISAGGNHSLALCSDGTLVAWGYGFYGELGNHARDNSGVPVAVDQTGVLAGKTVVRIAAGGFHNLVLCSDGTVAGWGSSRYGQLGTGGYDFTTTQPMLLDQTGVLASKTILQIAAASDHSLALCSDGTLAAWGAATHGQLGNNDYLDRMVPVAADLTGTLANRRITEIAAGSAHSLALCSDGTLAAWGSNPSGELGNGSNVSNSPIPVAVSTAMLTGTERFCSVNSSQDAHHVLALVATGPAPPSTIVQLQPSTSLTSSVTAVDFGTVTAPASASRSFTIKNTGELDLVLGEITFGGANPEDFHVTAGPSVTIAGGGSTTFTVTFTPVGLGLRNATLHIPSNDAASPFDILLKGTGQALAATASTLPAAAITVSGGTLRGTADANGTNTAVSFDYGLTTSYGSSVTATESPISGSSGQNATAVVTGLAAHTLYHYRIRAANLKGTVNGADKTFTTLDTPPVANADSAIALPGGAVTVNVLDNDTDADGDVLKLLAIKSAPPTSAGAAKIVGATIVFTPAAKFTGTSFTCTIGDGFGGTAIGAVDISLGSCALSPDSASMTAAAVSYPVTVTANAPWSAGEALNWATVSPLSGNGNGTVTVTLQANPTKASRSGSIIIGGQTHTILQAGTLGFTIAAPELVPNGMVSADYALTIPALTPPVKFTLGGQPPGLTINTATGVITGRPKKAGFFMLKVTGSTTAGAATTISIPLLIEALPGGAVGTFHGPIAREGALNNDLGGRFELTTTTTGSLSGKILLGATTYVFPATAELDATAGGADPMVAFDIPRKAPLPPLSVSFIIDSANHRLANGDITDGTHHAAFSGWHKKWGTMLTQPEKDSLNRYLGLHTFALKMPGAQPALPQGSGYGSFVVAANTGLLTAAGRLADGTSFTSASFAGPQGEVLIYQPLHGSKGSVAGVANLTPGTAGFSPPYGDNTLTGAVSWLRPAMAGRLYANGFGPVDLAVAGGRYVAPAPVTNIVMGITDNLAINNASLTFTGADLVNVSPSIAFRLKAKSVFVAPLALENTRHTSLTVSPGTGDFTGGFSLSDPNVIVTTAVRPATFYGKIVRDTDGVMRGYGYFLLADLPTLPGETVKNTKQQSGLVIFEKAP